MLRYRRALIILLICNILAICGIYLARVQLTIPKELSVTYGEETSFSFSVPASANVYKATSGESCGTLDLSRPFSLRGEEGDMKMEVSLFGLFPLKTVTVNVVEERQVVAAGIPIGIYVRTKGVMVVDISEVRDMDRGMVCPAEHIVKSGDYILEVNGETVGSRYEVMSALKHLKTSEVTLLIERAGQPQQVSLRCADTEDGYKLGVWIRDDMQGIGTMTYVDGRNYGALGHSITDQDTGKLVSLSDSTLYQATILSIKKGKAGTPGELGGMISYGHAFAIGSIEENTTKGIFGTLFADSKISGELMPVGYKQEIKEDTAYIRSWLSGEEKDYEIQIKKVNMGRSDSTKGLEIEVTDRDLLELTGGIVQGMSGSPIIQNGKIIGAVTHVFVNDPERGYGIFIDEMLDE